MLVEYTQLHRREGHSGYRACSITIPRRIRATITGFGMKCLLDCNVEPFFILWSQEKELADRILILQCGEPRFRERFRAPELKPFVLLKTLGLLAWASALLLGGNNSTKTASNS